MVKGFFPEIIVACRLEQRRTVSKRFLQMISNIQNIYKCFKLN